MVRVAVLLDGGYLRAVLKQHGEPPFNYETFSNDLLKEDEERLRTYYYTCMPYQGSPPTQEERERYRREDSFIFNLKRCTRFEVRLGRLVKIGGEFVQKRVDILLAVDLSRLSWGKQVEKVVIATGDSDFVPAVQAAKEAGVITRLWYDPLLPVHNDLLEVFDERYEITDELIRKNTREPKSP